MEAVTAIPFSLKLNFKIANNHGNNRKVNKMEDCQKSASETALLFLQTLNARIGLL